MVFRRDAKRNRLSVLEARLFWHIQVLEPRQGRPMKIDGVDLECRNRYHGPQEAQIYDDWGTNGDTEG